jgi:hypothetical protein
VSGVKKRAGSKFVSKIVPLVNTYYSSIERDNQEKYIIGIAPTGIKVWDLQGVEKTVSAPLGYSYLAGISGYKTLTLSDTTFIVNPDITVSMDPVLTPIGQTTGLISLRAIDYNLIYNISIEGVGASAVSFTAPSSGVLNIENAAVSLAAQLNSATNIDATSLGGVIKYTITNNAPYILKVWTSRGSDFITGIPGTVENFGDLPAVGFDGVTVKVNQNPTTDDDDFYVKFIGSGVGTWQESVKLGIKYRLDPTTMPHTLTRNNDGTFTFSPFVWSNRSVGDELSNIEPSFVGQKISNILFERNRLGFLSDVNIIMSESGAINNFWRSTVSTIIDSDPIDLSVPSRQVDTLRTSIGVKDGILLFSDSAQFLLSAGDSDILSPETAAIISVSDYTSNTAVEPVRIGESIFFSTRKDQSSGIREYLYSSGSDITATTDITEQVPELLPITVTDLTGSSTENILFCIGRTLSNIYVYQYLQSNQQKVVSAWSKWSFNASIILFAKVVDDFLYVVLSRVGGIYIERIPLNSSRRLPPLSDEVCLDEAGSTVGLSRAFSAGKTTFVFSRVFSKTPTLVSLVQRAQDNIFVGDKLTPFSIVSTATTTTVVMTGDWTNSQFYIGSTYLFSHEFSTVHLQIGEGEVDIEGRYQIRNMTITLDSTGECEFKVIYGDPSFDLSTVFVSDITDWALVTDMSSLSFTGSSSIQTHSYLLSRMFPDRDLTGRYTLVNHSARVPIMCQNTKYRLLVLSESYTPVTLVKAQIEAMYHKRSRLV